MYKRQEDREENAGGRIASPLEYFWESHHDILLLEILTFVDVVSLVQAKGVCRQLQRMATKAIDQKSNNNPRAFENGNELRITVRQYIKTVENPKDAESIARTYGWPIGKWDVSHVTDFSGMFDLCSTFNDDISDWNTSNATTMDYMFRLATSFNRPIGDWNTSNVGSMDFMFHGAASFNQPIGDWDASNVRSMIGMFRGAVNFNQPICLLYTSPSPRD